MRIFLDANILFSASFPNSLLANFLAELQQHATLLSNAYAKLEAERNIAAKAPSRIPAFHELVSRLELVPLQLFDLNVKLAEKDRPILCGAIAGRADYLLTGDKKDFGRLFGRTVRATKVVNV